MLIWALDLHTTRASNLNDLLAVLAGCASLSNQDCDPDFAKIGCKLSFGKYLCNVTVSPSTDDEVDG